MRRMILRLIEEIEEPIEEMKIFSEQIYLIKIDSIVNTIQILKKKCLTNKNKNIDGAELDIKI